MQTIKLYGAETEAFNLHPVTSASMILPELRVSCCEHYGNRFERLALRQLHYWR